MMYYNHSYQLHIYIFFCHLYFRYLSLLYLVPVIKKPKRLLFVNNDDKINSTAMDATYNTRFDIININFSSSNSYLILLCKTLENAREFSVLLENNVRINCIILKSSTVL